MPQLNPPFVVYAVVDHSLALITYSLVKDAGLFVYHAVRTFRVTCTLPADEMESLARLNVFMISRDLEKYGTVADATALIYSKLVREHGESCVE